MKRVVFLLVILSMMLTLSITSQPVLSQSLGDTEAQAHDFVPGQVIVGFREEVELKSVPAQASALAGEVQAAVVKVQGSAALLEFAPHADVEALAQQIEALPNVAYAEANTIFTVPHSPDLQSKPNAEIIIRRVYTENGYKQTPIPVDTLRMMKVQVKGKIQSVYPNDSELWVNNGWWDIGADIVSPNKTPSRSVCVIDTGVDYNHPDLKGRVLRGRDIVNDDADPMDDNGHGTHVAGIIAAKQGNKIGIAGVSTGRVVAVKALTAQGIGTSFDIATAIYQCANRVDVGVINMSLGSPTRSKMQEDAVKYAVDLMGKVIVAASGNDGSSTMVYPAAFSLDYPNKVLSVAATGIYDDSFGWWGINNDCRAVGSNYGDWVDIAAPGTLIFSTLPYKKSFYIGENYFNYGYGVLSGTSQSASFVSAVVARAWGYQPGFTNTEVSAWVKAWGDRLENPKYEDDDEPESKCWPDENNGIRRVNVAAALQRGAAYAAAFDANTHQSLARATISVHQNGLLRGSTRLVLGPTRDFYPWFSLLRSGADILNLPVSAQNEMGDYLADYQGRVHRSGYTTSPQAAFVNPETNTGHFVVFPGAFNFVGDAFVPQRSRNFTAIHHHVYTKGSSDLVTFLPDLPKPVDDGQPARFVVSWRSGWQSGFDLDGETIGSLSVFPYARHLIEGELAGYGYDTTVVRSKPGTPAVPFYTGAYVFAVYTEDKLENLSFFIWKDGVIRMRVDASCAGAWWRPLTLSQFKGAAVYTVDNTCGGEEILPYPPPTR
jgi:subtilisin family serine protease